MDWSMSFITGIDMDATGKQIGRLIDKGNISDKHLGEMIGVSVQSINKWRHSHCLPDIENLFLLGQILGAKVEDFFIFREIEICRIEQKKIVDSTSKYLIEYYRESITKKAVSTNG